MKTEMSKQEARKITIIEELLAGRFTNKQAAQCFWYNKNRAFRNLKIPA
jgi:hypothetical protein